MATKEQIETVLSEISERFEKMFSYSIEELTREEELGTQFSFKEIEDYFVRIIDLFKRVKEVNLNEVPFNLLTNFNAQLQNAITYFDQAKDFNAAVNNSAAVRQGIIDQIRNQYDNYYTHSIPILSIGLLNSNDLSVERSKMNQLIADLEEEKKNSKKESEAKLQELNDIIENAKSFATKAGVSKHSSVFQSESNFHKTESKKWLGYTTKILIGIVAVAIGLAFLGLLFTDSTQLIQFTITKVVVLSALFYGLALTNRNYKAHKHNEILNKHRQNALTTFETFSNAASDEQTKNAILLETTRSIFTNQQTGYLKKEGEKESGNKIVEIIKNVTTKE